MKLCALFPGQGFQCLGALKQLADNKAVKPLLEQCDEVLPGLSGLLLGTSEQDVTPTEIAQPFLMAASTAQYLVNSPNKPVFAMGHSVGEYSAFVAAGLLPFKTALQLLRARGDAMRDAGQQVEKPNGMTLVMKPRKMLTEEWKTAVQQAAAAYNVDIGAYNSPASIVLTGIKADMEKAVDSLKQQLQGQRIIIKPLSVSAAFHSRHMKPASTRLEQLLHKVDWGDFSAAKFPVISNMTAREYNSLAEIQTSCVRALCEPVKWMQSVEYVEPQIDEFASFGGDIGALMARNVSKPNTVYA